MRLPDFLIIGAQKSGTTSLQYLLGAHPQIECLGELHFFCGENGDHDLRWYGARFAALPEGALVGEKCPCYLADPEAVERMAAAVPEARLIAVLRDPVRRTQAHYWHERRLGNEGLGIADALAQERRREAGGRPGFGYLENSRYLRQLERVSAYFGRDRLCVLLFEELVADPAGALASVAAFLGLEPPRGPVELPRANPYREYRARWLLDAMYARRLWRFLPRRAAIALHGALVREREYPPLDPGLERELRDEFAAEAENLARWLGRDLPAWGAPAGPGRR